MTLEIRTECLGKRSCQMLPSPMRTRKHSKHQILHSTKNTLKRNESILIYGDSMKLLRNIICNLVKNKNKNLHDFF